MAILQNLVMPIWTKCSDSFLWDFYWFMRHVYIHKWYLWHRKYSAEINTFNDALAAVNNSYALADLATCWNRRRRPAVAFVRRAARTIQNTSARSQRRYTFYQRAHLPRVMAAGKDSRRISTKMVTIDTGRYSRSRALAGKKSAANASRANNTPRRQYSRPRNNWLPRAIVAAGTERWRSPARVSSSPGALRRICTARFRRFRANHILSGKK